MSENIEVSYKKNGCYPVIIESGLAKLCGYIRDLYPSLVRICIVSDTNVSKFYGDAVRTALDGCCEHINIHYSYFNKEFKCPNYAGPHQYEEISSVVHTVNGLPVIEGTYRCKYCGCTCVQWGTRSW